VVARTPSGSVACGHFAIISLLKVLPILTRTRARTTQSQFLAPFAARSEDASLVVWFEKLGRGDVARVGGKNASLGEMVRVRVPPGFATTADAYWRYVEANRLRTTVVDSLAALEAGHASLAEVGVKIRRAFLRGTWPKEIAEAIQTAYRELCRRAAKTDVIGLHGYLVRVVLLGERSQPGAPVRLKGVVALSWQADRVHRRV
jgi:hypothetical protein